MGRADYDVRESYTGTGALSAYTFDFKIEELKQLLVIELDATGVETERVRGTDVVYLSSVVFDAVDGAGTVNLTANLASGYTLIILLANDEPTQPYEFKAKGSFSLDRLEAALDFAVGGLQRAFYRASRSVQLNESIPLVDFDPTLPVEVTDAVSQTIVTKADGTGLEIGPDITTVTGAVAAAAAAAVSEANASTSAAAALVSELAAAVSAAEALASELAAAASAASVGSVWAPHVIVDGQAATALTDEDWLSALYVEARYEFSIIRGTTVNASGTFKVQLQNGTWRIKLGSYVGDIHGVTFSLTGTTTQQLNAALDAGAGNGIVNLSRRLVAV
jgi:hypothetical protein